MATSRRLLRIGDYYDELAHRALVARLARCSTCGVPVPLPTTTGECVHCFRRDDPNGSRVAPIQPPPAAQPLPIPDGEGAQVETPAVTAS